MAKEKLYVWVLWDNDDLISIFASKDIAVESRSNLIRREISIIQKEDISQEDKEYYLSRIQDRYLLTRQNLIV